MRSTLKFLWALLVACVLMQAFRALALTIYTVPGKALEPHFQEGDRVLVNRWSYGLRTGGESLFPYGRLCRQPVGRGDFLAYEDSLGRVLIGQCMALPGDSISLNGRPAVVPGRASCATQDFYALADGRSLIAEACIIGRVVLVVYNHDADYPFWGGYLASRFLLRK